MTDQAHAEKPHDLSSAEDAPAMAPTPRKSKWVVALWVGAFVLLVLALSQPSFLSCSSEEDQGADIYPSQFRSMTVYAAPGLANEDLDDSDLPGLANLEVDGATMRKIVARTEYKPAKPDWRVSYLAVVMLDDDRQCRLAISADTPEFAIVGQDGYYRAGGESVDVLKQMMKRLIEARELSPSVPLAQ